MNKKKKNKNTILIILVIIFFIIIILKIFKLHFFVKDNDIIVVKQASEQVNDVVCFKDNSTNSLKISRIVIKKDDGKYITKQDGSYYYDDNALRSSDIKGIYITKIKNLYGIVTSKIFIAIIIILLIINLYINEKKKRMSLKRLAKKKKIM